jgi:hypothetical protein
MAVPTGNAMTMSANIITIAPNPILARRDLFLINILLIIFSNPTMNKIIETSLTIDTIVNPGPKDETRCF